MRLIIIVLFLFTFSVSALADLTIHITQGVDKPYPAAVVPFGNGFSNIISNDLRSSGRFDLLAKTNMPALASSMQNFSWSAWRTTKVEFVLLGKVTKLSSGSSKVSYELLSMLGNKPLAGKVFSSIKPKQMRALAHFISDQVYQVITGQKGAFATRLAYVAVTNKAKKNAVYKLIVADVDGKNAKVLLSQVGVPIASPKWSPNGKNLAYVSYIHNRMAIYSINLKTGSRKIIANFKGINSAPAWSPNGRDMAMALSKGQGAVTNIYVMNLVSGKIERVTSFGTNTSPAWSPDGKDIVFTSNRGGSPQIYQLNLKARQVTRLTYEGSANLSPVYTPNGDYVVLMHQELSGGQIQIARYNLATGNMLILTTGQLDKSPSVAPNGGMVIYANYDRPNGVLAEVSINGKIQLLLPAPKGSVQSPAWGPF